MLFTPRTAGLYLTGNGSDENEIVLADIHKRVRTAARTEMATAGNEHFRFAVADRLCLSGQNDDNFARVHMFVHTDGRTRLQPCRQKLNVVFIDRFKVYRALAAVEFFDTFFG